MMATWMLYCSLCALGLTFAAALAERTLLAGRGPVRLVWVAAIALSFAIPLAAFRSAGRAHADPIVLPMPGSPLTIASPGATPAVMAPVAGLPSIPIREAAWVTASSVRVGELERALQRYDGRLFAAWVALSIVLALNLAGGMVALSRMRRGWRRHVVHGVPVFVSTHTGPAVVGTLSPAVVLPEWALAMEPAQLALMLRHEQEHQRAGDARLLTLAHLALVAMPWNPALWWQIARLRGAIELDCDARVLRDADARSYGDLLLEVARPRRGPRLIGATAFAERATQLERRIRVLPRHRSHTSRGARVIAACIGLAATTAAWSSPHPAAPARSVLESSPLSLELGPPTRTAEEAPARSTPVRPDSRRESQGASLRDRHRVSANSTRIAATPRIRKTPCASAAVDSVFNILFDGVTLTVDQAATACDMLATLHEQQAVIDQVTTGVIEAGQAKMFAARAQRDSALRALLTTDADRATFDANLSQNPVGGRGRSAGPPPDGIAGALRLSGGRTGNGRGTFIGDTVLYRAGARGGGVTQGSLPELRERLVAITADLTYRHLFDGIALTPEQETSARTLISNTQQALLLPPRIEPPSLRLNPRTGMVAMRAENAAALLHLVSRDADRALVESRIVTIP